MRLTHYGHACVLVEDVGEGAGRILFDPGNLADDVSGIGSVDAVMITHEHPDHIDTAQLASVRRASPAMQLYVSPGVMQVLPEAEKEQAIVLAEDSDAISVAGWDVAVSTSRHAVIHPSLPNVDNNAYLVDGRLWHPGDSLVRPSHDVDVLLLPIGAPWLKLAEAIDYLVATAPRLVVPIHQGGLAQAHRALHGDLLTRFAPKGTQFLQPAPGASIDV